MTDHTPPGKGIGKSMLIVAWAIILIGLTLAFGSWEENQYNPNQSIEAIESTTQRQVKLERNRQHHYVVTGKINNTNVVFMLDTGATDVVVPQRLARKLGLQSGAKGIAITANGPVEVYSTNIEQLELGSIVLKDVRASINPAMKHQEILLGMSALKDLDFSQSGNTLTLTQYVR